ncbi:MAG TPA: hypothetical protein VMT16_08990, partial [Thermoanaerobaculia bacterium]|nr:hypothetical protein [Thermoanaerobaculia bacterium]
PRWRRDGRELYYRSRDMLVAVTVDADGTVGEEVELFPLPGAFDVAPDGRFLVIEPEGEVSPPITVMLDWLPPELAQ